MMVGTYRQPLACVAAQLNGVKRHGSMKPSSRDPQLGLASPLNYAANKSGKIKIKSPSQKEAGLDGSDAPWLRARGRERLFFLTSSFTGRVISGFFASYHGRKQRRPSCRLLVSRLFH